MISYLAAAGGHLLKRGQEKAVEYELPGWTIWVVLLDFVLFFPVLIFLGYTLGSLYPTLAMVEDPNPPAYEPVSLNDESASIAEEPATPAARVAKAGGQPSRPITSSLRQIRRLLHQVGGWRANVRGIVPALVFQLGLSAVTGLFLAVPFVPAFVGTLLANLALVQLSTAWVHIVMTPRAPGRRFWHCLPPLRRTFAAAWRPVLACWAATTVQQYLPLLASRALGLPVWDPRRPEGGPELDAVSPAKGLAVVVISLAATVLLLVPARVALVRVQASLLPEDQDAIVPFDRSFGGAVEPAVVGGRGFVSMADALKTFPRASWVRLYKLYAKIFALSIVLWGLMLAVIIPEVFAIARNTEQVKN